MKHAELVVDNILPFRATPAIAPTSKTVGDLRFRTLLGARAWQALPAAVRTRFSKRLGGTQAALYTGEILETRMSRCGWLLAQMLRLIGGPLPISRDVGVPAIVSVTEDESSGGQLWTRIYGNHNGFPQVIHSAKRFAGVTGLEEYIGWGIGMALRVDADDIAIHFRSTHYFLTVFGARMKLPRWLCPGQTTVSHVDMEDGNFAFVLDLTHIWLGELIHQTAFFRDS
jgi:Domain of unknown function (DUF4166)